MAGTQFVTPVGRWVDGDIWKGQTKDMDGNPLVYKTGQDAGKPRMNYYFGFAIPKAGEQHWNQTPWGAIIYNTGVSGFPAAPQRPNFAWKIIDGDSQVPNDRGRKPCDNEGYPGHWVLRLSGAFAPSVNVWMDKWVETSDQDAVKRGYYVQVQAEVEFNKNATKPGVYLNHRGVVLNRPGEEIKGGAFDANNAGFAAPPAPYQAPAPTGFAPAPVVGAPPALPVAAAIQHTMTAKAGGATYEAMVAAGWTDDLLISNGMMVAPVTVAPAPYQPHPAILTPPLPVPPPVPVAHQMTAKANGVTYEAMVAAGWNDDMLHQHGMMV